MGKAGLVLSIIGLAFCILGYISITRPLPLLLLGPLGVTIGILLSVVGFYRARKAGTSLKIPIAGLATGVVALVPSLWAIVVILLWLGGWES